MALKAAKKQYTAYLGDGTAINFTHAIDYFNGLRSGMNPRPLGAAAPVIEPEPEGEKVAGIAPIVSEKVEPPVAEHIEDGKPKKTKLNR